MTKTRSRKICISSSLMCGNLFNLKEDLNTLQEHNFDYLHLDVMDGHFVPNIMFGYDFVNRISSITSTPKDIHLMMDYPDMAIRSLQLNDKDLVTFHLESRSDPGYTIQCIRDKGGKVGMAINPDTPIENVYPFLDKIDHVLVMTIHPGFSGHPFVQSSYERVRILSNHISSKNPNVTIGIDGAVGLKEIMAFSLLGVELFVLGTTGLFKENLEKQAIAVKKFVKNLEASWAE